MKKRKLNTLVIEDDPLSVAVLKHYSKNLTEFELDIYHVVTLEEALEFLDTHPQPDLIFLDYRVHSKITGLEILQHIRGRGINIPVIVITGSGDEEVAVAMIKAGASDYLVKGNLSLSRLEKAIKDALSWYENFGEVLEEKPILMKIALKTSLSGVCISDIKGKITYVNPSFAKMWGYKEEECKGKKLKSLFSDEELIKELIEKKLKERKTWLGELRGRRKDNSLFYVQSLFSLIEDEKKIPHILASFIDITRVREEEKKREALYKGIMEVFALKAEEVGNVETADHIHRIAEYTRFIAEKLKELEEFKDYIDEKYINDISYASMLHDVGKWRTPNEILLKPSELTEAEWEIIKQHPRLGVEMLSPLLKDKGSSQYLKLVESIVLYHHERWDGSGYPEGLKGEEIPLSARIVAIADVYDALTSNRSYREALTHEEAVEVIRKEKNKFDPRIWKIFMDNHWEFKKIKERYGK